MHPFKLLLQPRDTSSTRTYGSSAALWYGLAPTPFGPGLIGWTEDGIVMLHLQQTGDPALQDLLGHRYPGSTLRPADQEAHKLMRRVWSPSFCNTQPQSAEPSLCLVLRGTPFQLLVWQTLMNIPFGEVRTYGELAASLGHPGAARAVGTAVASNTLAYAVPCHRVVRATGQRGQYRWGAERKVQILDWEARQLAQPLASR